jgi:nitrous oxide reductase accessory protein NosL
MLSIILAMSRVENTRYLAALCLLALLAGCASTAGPPSEKDRCPVCGMSVAAYENWIASVVFHDGQEVFFDGPKDLFRFLHDPGKYGRAADGIAEIRVTDYYTTRPIEAHDAVFVAGSDVMGPMGHELVALRSRNEAESFVKDHGGNAILEFDEVTEEQIPK